MKNKKEIISWIKKIIIFSVVISAISFVGIYSYEMYQIKLEEKIKLDKEKGIQERRELINSKIKLISQSITDKPNSTLIDTVNIRRLGKSNIILEFQNISDKRIIGVKYIPTFKDNFGDDISNTCNKKYYKEIYFSNDFGSNIINHEKINEINIGGASKIELELTCESDIHNIDVEFIDIIFEDGERIKLYN